MILDIKAPTPGESITEVQIAAWLVNDGDFVEKDKEIAEVDSDKATLTVSAEAAGILKILVHAGETVRIASVIGTIDTSAAPAEKPEQAKPDTKPEPIAAPEPVKSKPAEEAKPLASQHDKALHITPLARKLMEEKNLSDADVLNHIRITRKDIDEVKPAVEKPVLQPVTGWGGTREQERKKLSTLRLKLADRLVSVKNQTAMLTTFNEVNMSAIMAMKKQYNDAFKQNYGVGIGFMSLFTKAVTIAMGNFPQVNAMIDGDELVMSHYADIGIAVSAPKGLVVPVIRNAESLSLAELELRIKELAVKARENKITIEEMTGGTFTITNGGVFGSLLSTPILNPPQSAILGMHNIVERPIAVNGQVVIAPMMYVALSYDHRVIDGRESVSFLVKVKELLENPVKMLFNGDEPMKVLLGV
ncbi:MAG TPA: 2-oxoglutarate dehydrogenase complex dihydrolipoyllysine-residue succinyltransferase [Bacteroidales bacterium]|nr:2-oxoglutarate dehydrogenase complex dihydrolipoyllysine-residue succinyltransferase [Bacteroidales bacterium]